ncbi:MAG: hypothetical protein QME51_08025, partial [Planctomycetota bacterium]|nr:hypothetical protein [Planctomycetota bacterium]
PAIWKDRIELNLLGTIRLGKREPTGRKKDCVHPQDKLCFRCSRPTVVPHFILPEKIRDKFPVNPTELDIAVLNKDFSEIFPKSLCLYGATRKKCEGNGEEAQRWDEAKGELVTIPCPCKELKSEENPKGQCKITAHFFFFLPTVTMGGVYRLVVSSVRSINGILNGLRMAKEQLGHLSVLPLLLVREPAETIYKDEKGEHKKIIFPVKISSRLDLAKMGAILAATKDNQMLTTARQICLPEPGGVGPEDHEPEILSDEEKAETNEIPKTESTAVDIRKIFITDHQSKKLYAVMGELKMDKDTLRKIAVALYGIESSKDLEVGQASSLINYLEDMKAGRCELTWTPDGKPAFVYPDGEQPPF